MDEFKWKTSGWLEYECVRRRTKNFNISSSKWVTHTNAAFRNSASRFRCSFLLFWSHMHTTALSRAIHICIFDGLSNFGNLFLVLGVLVLIRQSKMNNQSSLLILNIHLYIFMFWCKSTARVDEENEQNFVVYANSVTKQPNETS